MYEIEIEAGEMRAANFIASHAELLTIRLRKSSFTMLDTLEPRPDEESFFRFKWNTQPHMILEPGHLAAHVGLKFELFSRLSPSKEEVPVDPQQKLLAMIELLYEIRYAIPVAPLPEEIERIGGLSAFAKWNTLFNCWPFFREEVRRLGGAAELPVLALPLLKFRPRASGETAAKS